MSLRTSGSIQIRSTTSSCRRPIVRRPWRCTTATRTKGANRRRSRSSRSSGSRVRRGSRNREQQQALPEETSSRLRSRERQLALDKETSSRLWSREPQEAPERELEQRARRSNPSPTSRNLGTAHSPSHGPRICRQIGARWWRSRRCRVRRSSASHRHPVPGRHGHHLPWQTRRPTETDTHMLIRMRRGRGSIFF